MPYSDVALCQNSEEPKFWSIKRLRLDSSIWFSSVVPWLYWWRRVYVCHTGSPWVLFGWCVGFLFSLLLRLTHFSHFKCTTPTPHQTCDLMSTKEYLSHTGRNRSVCWNHFHAECFFMSRNKLVFAMLIVSGDLMITRKWLSHTQRNRTRAYVEPICASCKVLLFLWMRWSWF